MKKLFLVWLLVIGYWLFVSGSVQAAIYYVDAATTEGNVVGNGSEGNPWQTITWAMAQVAAGDTVNVAAGTYSTAMSGSDEAFPITVPASINLNSTAGAGTTTISAGDVVANRAIIAGNNSTIEGFTVTANVNSGYALIRTAINTQIKNNIVISGSNGAIGIDIAQIGYAANNSITHGGTSSYGIYVRGAADGSTIESCVITSNGTSAEGISTSSATDNLTIRNCTIEANGSNNIGICLPLINANYLITGNRLTGNYADSLYGIEATSGLNGTIGTNEIRGFGYGIMVSPNSGYTSTINHNTIIENRWIGIYHYRSGSFANITNCIVSASPEGGTASGYGIWCNPGATTTVTYSDIYGNLSDYSGSGTIVTGVGTISANAKFVNLAGHDYRLSSGSPCINSGTPAGADMGAYAYDYTTPAVYVSSPVGSESWEAASAHNITWRASNESVPVDAIDLAYTTNEGTSYVTIATGQGDSGSYAWTIPAVNSTVSRVRVTAWAGSSSGTGESASNFTIYFSDIPTAPTAIYPTTGTSTDDAAPDFSWSVSAAVSGIASYEVRIDGLTVATQGATTTYTPSTDLTLASHTWDARAKSNAGLWGDFSSMQIFTVEAVPTVEVSITSPGGGDNWQEESIHYITWSTSGDVVSVDLHYSTDNGTTFNSIASGISNTGSYSWILPKADSTQSKIRAAVHSSTKTATAESAAFTISSKSVKLQGQVNPYPTVYKPLTSPTLKLGYQLSTDADVTIYLINKYGKVHWKTSVASGNNGGKAGYNEVDCSGISELSRGYVPNGIYFIKIVSQNRVIATGHLVVQD